MKFSRLRLLGFKSFVEPGEFVIERGLTGIVGPNGCGKSNLVEALRWVMGESSYKNMRASGMDDVIFSGSGTRPARNTAEVTLFLDNVDRTAPAAFNDADELQVSRRIEREAGSVYRINGKEARAKDVQLLFADQSTGARSPSMVGQGRIGELIQAKPQARRALLEEAAGISGLHTRRHEAELRLRAAEQNLERLDDVVGELESQIESLKRQARQASRFKNLSADIRKAEATLLHVRWTLAKAQEAEAQSALVFGDIGRRRARAAPRWRPRRNRRSARIACRNCARPKPPPPPPSSACPSPRRRSRKRRRASSAATRNSRRRLEQLDADIAREEQMVRDNADVLQRLDTEEATLNQENASLAGAGDLDARGFRGGFGGAYAERSSTCEADGRARRGRRRAQPDRAHVARDGRAARAARAAACDCRPRDRRDRRADRRACRSGGEEAARRTGAGDAGSRRGSCECCRKGGGRGARRGKRRASALAGGARRTRPHRDRGAHARQDSQCRDRRPFPGGAGADHASIAALRQRLAPHSAKISTPRSIRGAPAHWADIDCRRRGPGAAGRRAQPCKRRARRRVSWRGAWRRSASSTPRTDAGCRCLLKTGQRLVSREGALWRWDGFTASADAPTAAAQRLAQKNRLAELDAEMAAATLKVRTAEAALAAAENTVRERVAGEAAARQAWRDAPACARRSARCAGAGRKGGRRAVGPARRLWRSRARASPTILSKRRPPSLKPKLSLPAAPDLGDLGDRLEALAATVARDRGVLADARALHEGLKREAEARVRRLGAIADRSRHLGAARGERRSADRFARRAPRRDRCPNSKRWRMRPTRSTPSGARC